MAFTKKTVRDIDVAGKKIIMRVDFNVPLKDGVVTDDTRVRAAIPTIQYLKEHGAGIILMSHLGRPKGDGPEPALSLKPAADKLAELTGYDVKFCDDTYGEKAAEACAAVQPGDILVLENVRFLKAEKKNDPEVAKKLASYGDIFVLDAFGTAHRAQGSVVVGPAAYLPAVAGFLLEKEVDTLTSIFAEPERPFVAIVGGSKVSSKIGVLDHLIDSADTLIIGGGMAYTFFLAKGYTVGTSLKEEDWVERAGEMLKKAEAKGVKILLPIDNVVAPEFKDEPGTVVASDAIPDDQMGMDIGPKTEELYAEAIKGAKTVFWNGPTGVFEFENFQHGTKAVAEAVAEVKANGGTSIIGGGDSVAAINKFGLADKMSWISTGGGASMELVEGKALPGVEALLDA